jgi:hypothetical protein
MDWLVYAHPVGMVAVVILGLLVLREGLALRSRRLRRLPRNTARHRRLAKILIPAMAIGWAGGVASMVLIRHEEMFGSIHWPFGTSALVLLTAGGLIGLQMERGRWRDQRTAHVAFGALGMLLTLGAWVAGMSILP